MAPHPHSIPQLVQYQQQSNANNISPMPSSYMLSSPAPQHAVQHPPNTKIDGNTGQLGYVQASPVHVVQPAAVYQPTPNTALPPVANHQPSITAANTVPPQVVYATPTMTQPMMHQPVMPSLTAHSAIAQQPITVNSGVSNPQYVFPGPQQASMSMFPPPPGATNNPCSLQNPTLYYPATALQPKPPQSAMQAQVPTTMGSGPQRPSQVAAPPKTVASSVKKIFKGSTGKKVALVGGGLLAGAAGLIGLDIGDSMAGSFEGCDAGAGAEYASGGGDFADASQQVCEPPADASYGGGSDPTAAVWESNLDNVAYNSAMTADTMNNI